MSVIPRKMLSAQGAAIVNHSAIVISLRVVNLLRVVFLVQLPYKDPVILKILGHSNSLKNLTSVHKESRLLHFPFD